MCARTRDLKQPAPVCLGPYTIIMNYSAFYCVQCPVDHNSNEGNIPVYHCHPLWLLSRGMWTCFTTINYGIIFREVIFTFSQVSIPSSLPSSLSFTLSHPPKWLHPPTDISCVHKVFVHLLWAHIPEFPMCGCLSAFFLLVWLQWLLPHIRSLTKVSTVLF